MEVPRIHLAVHSKSREYRSDKLAKAAANNLPIPHGAFYQVLQSPATQTTAKAFKTILVTESED